MRSFLLLITLLLLCGAVHAQPLPDLVPYRQDTKWGYADTMGNVVIPAQWDEADFFKESRALVALKSNIRPEQKIHCVINKRGEYIIPPERNWHWNRNFKGLSSPLNSVDDNSKWGMIDSNLNMIIPYLWDKPGSVSESTNDSLKVVGKDGYAYLINAKNEVLSGGKYADIKIQPLLYQRLHAYIVTDPDNKSGNNKYGVADNDGKLLLPTVYSSIEYREGNGRKGFDVSIAAVNETQDYTQPAARSKWLDYPSMKEGKAPPLPNAEPQYSDVKQIGSHTLFSYAGYSGGYGLKDRNGKILINCCEVKDTHGDTILKQTYETKGDTQIIATHFLNIQTLRPMRPPTQRYIYQRPLEYDYPQRFTCGNGARAFAEGQARRSQLPSVMIEGREVKEFFKDSFLFHVQEQIADRPVTVNSISNLHGRYHPYNNLLQKGELALIYGEVRGSNRWYGQSYFALVDDSANYVVPPRLSGPIVAYNRKDDIITQRGYPTQLLNLAGDTLWHAHSAINPLGAFRWHKKYYLYIETDRSLKAGTTISGYGSTPKDKKIADTSGNLLGLWKLYAMSSYIPAAIAGDADPAFWAADSNGLQYALNGDGQIILPHLSGKYKRITVVNDKWLWVWDAANNQKLVDLFNNDMLPGINITSIDTYHPYYHQQGIDLISGRFFMVSGSRYDGSNAQLFYIDDNGTAYTNLATSVKNKRKK